ncbi:LCP family protein [Faecalibacterium wellingii]|uniref:LCP family protein n=1 Tax=Faecalibacterium wellingii TaxID=2929491 RepID=A0ABU3TXU7_9FIRM|nr:MULTISPECIES: LCP family protein [Faecalibacterium]MDU8688123.1 LCP family protein [Faecalibacterium prausnitzii]UQK55773.1 LCP family protein [Faecalibacterium sp. HTF-F]
MMDENDRSHEDYRSLRHISRKEGSEDTAPIEVDSSAFFSETPPEPPQTPPPKRPSAQKPTHKHHDAPVPPQAHPPVDGAVAVPSKWGNILLILQGLLSVLSLVQLWRTQMLPVLYLVILAALLALLWLLVKRCQEYNVPGKVARVFSVFLCAAMALGCFWAQQGLSALGSMTSGLLTGAEANKITKEPFVIYLSGVDTRGELTENARSDVNILAAVNPVTKRVALVNTPRDYYVDLAGTDSKDKLTHAGLYGVETSMETLGNLYGVNVDHYIRINFAGFISIIDALGGVDVYSDQAFTSVGSPGYYDPTTFVEGWNHLDGKSALAFARERHAFASGDIQRGINQMKVIDAMLNKIKSPALLMGFSKIMDAASDCFVTSFSQDQISALVRMQLSDFAEWDIESYTVTGTSSSSTKCYSAKGQKLYVMKPDDSSVSKAREMIASVMGGEGTVADTTQKPEKTEVFTPTTDPNAAVSEVPAESVPEEVPAESVPEETVPADQPADAEQPADTQTPEPEAPAEGETGGDTPAEAPSISLPTQEEVEQAASSIYNAASSIWGAIQDAASQQNDAA